MSSSDASRTVLPNDLSADPPDILHDLQPLLHMETAERLDTSRMIQSPGGVS
jgi:hypothetical protein